MKKSKVSFIKTKKILFNSQGQIKVRKNLLAINVKKYFFYLMTKGS
jgi:hypothetical protein